MKRAKLPMQYTNYVFDLYGTLVDIHTDENQQEVWEKLALFYGYYGAAYEPAELKDAYMTLVGSKEQSLRTALAQDVRYSHEASPEIEITEVFAELYEAKGVSISREQAIHTGQFFRVLTTEYVRLYEGTTQMLSSLRQQGKKVYLLSNAQRIFTAYEMRLLDIEQYFDGILISSDYRTKKPDKRFFDALLMEYPMNPKETLFIGNDSRSDIGGAKTVGLATFYVKSNISPQGDKALDADYSVDNFNGWTC